MYILKLKFINDVQATRMTHLYSVFDIHWGISVNLNSHANIATNLIYVILIETSTTFNTRVS